jgi:hypothetical protein
MTQLDTDTARLVAALADLQGRISELTEQAEGIKAELRTLPANDYDIDGRPALRILPTRRFDAAAALAALPEAVRPTCLKVEPDPAAIKRHLTPDQAETFMVESGKPKCVLL